MDRLRDAHDDEAVEFEQSIGEHDQAAVRSALAALSAEGLIALDDHSRASLRR